MFTTYSRGRDGNQANSVHDLGSDRELHLRTQRRPDGRLVSNASVHRLERGFLVHVMGFAPGEGDFSKPVVVTLPARVTANVVKVQHEQCLTKLQEILEAVDLHYGVSARATHAI